MNPQEKALSLCQRFGWVGIKHEQTNYTTFNIEIAKELAIIAVDEILSMDLKPRIYREFWEQVKQEIEKL